MRGRDLPIQESLLRSFEISDVVRKVVGQSQNIQDLGYLPPVMGLMEEEELKGGTGPGPAQDAP